MADFESLYRDHFLDVFHYLRALTREEVLAEELAEQTFFQALRGLEHFRGDCDARLWLCRIAKRVYLTHLRKAKRSAPCACPEAALPVDWLGQWADHDTAARLHEALHNLPEPYKEVFSLRVFGELPFRQIGSLFGKTDHWACVVYHRAQRKLQQALQGGER